MSWLNTNFGQTDLKALCAPRAIFPGEYHVQNELYGFHRIIKEYAGLPPDRPLPWAMEHALLFGQSQAHFADIGTALPVRLAMNEAQAAVLAAAVKAPVTAIGSPFFYMRSLFDQRYSDQPLPPRRGTLAFPDKSTEDLDTDFDRARFAADLAALPAEFQPVAVSLSWKDVERGHHLDYLRAGLTPVSSGHPYDDMFLFRQFDLCRRFKYACANDISASFCYAVLAGCRFFYWPTGRLKISQHGTTREFDRDPTLLLDAKQQCLAAAPYPPANGANEAQLALAERLAGRTSVRPPEFFRRLAADTRRLLLAAPAAPIRFDEIDRLDTLASWLPWGCDTDGWCRPRCGLHLRWREGRTAIRIAVLAPEALELRVFRDDELLQTVSLSAGDASLTFPVRNLQEQAPLALECDRQFSLHPSARQRSLRICSVDWVNAEADMPLSLPA